MIALRLLPALIVISCAGAPPAPLTNGFAEPPAVPAAALAPDEKPLTPDQLRADLSALYDGLQAAHYDLYARRPKAEYDALFAGLHAAMDRPLHPSEAVFVFQRFAAFGNVAHARVEGTTAVWARYREAGGKALPVYPRIRDGRVFVETSHTDGIDVGDEVVAIDGQSAAAWLARLARNVSADNDYLAATQLELLFPLALWAETGPVDAVTLTLRAPDGARRTVSVPTIDQDTLTARAAAAAAPHFSLDARGREARVLDGGIAYLQPGPFYGVETPDNPWDPSAFTRFIDQSFDAFLAADARALLIDLRQNPGGDSAFSDPMIAWFADAPFRFASAFRIRSSAQSEASNQARIDLNPGSADGVSGDFARAYAATPYGETFTHALDAATPRTGPRFGGPVFALIDRYSYSNAANVAALLQDDGFATILGEETSDLATTYGAMETFALPHSDLTVGYPKALIVRPSGAMDDRGVVPDIAIEAPLFATTDVMLDTALAQVRAALPAE